MKNKNYRDHNRRILAAKCEIKRVFYKSILRNGKLSSAIKYEAILRLNSLSKNSSKVRINNRCILSGRSKSVYKFCKFSRIIFRELASKNALNGVVKSSW